jgi:mannosyltransferase
MTDQRLLPARQKIALLAITAVGLGLRFFRLGSQSYWLDEAISLSIARANLSTILTNAIQSSHPPLYYLVLKAWLALGVGVSEAAARLPSALLSTAAIPAVYMMARTLFPQKRRLGLLAAGLVAVAPFVIVYAQEARMYALQLLLVPLMLSAFFRAWREGDPRWWAIYAVTATLGAYTQYFTFLAVGGLHLVALLDRPRWGMRWRGLLLSDLAVALLFAPQVAVFFGQTGIALASDWMAADPIYLIQALHTLILSYSLPTWGVAVGFFVTLSLAVLGTYQMILALRRSGESAARQALWLVLLTFWPPLLLIAVTIVVRPFYMPYRSLTVVIPSYVILLAYGLSGARRRSPLPILYGILAVLIVLSLGAYYFDLRFAKPPYRDAAALIAERAEPEDIELHTSDGSYLPFLYYEQPVPVYLLTGDPDARKPEPVYALMGGQTLGREEVLAQDRRIWLVVALEHSIDYQLETLDWFQGQRPLLQEANVGGIRVYLLGS